MECKNCYTCQNCFQCEGSCYTCEVGYVAQAEEEELTCNVRQVSGGQGSEKVEFPDIWHAIYDALDRIAYQLEKQNAILAEINKKLNQSAQVRRPVNQNVGRQRGVNVRRRVLASVEEELKFVPDTVGKVKIKKQLKLD